MSRILKFNRFSHCFQHFRQRNLAKELSIDTQVCLAFWGSWMLFLLTKAGQNSVQDGTTAAEAFKILIKVQVWRNSIVWLRLEVYTELFIWESFVGFHRWKRWNPSSMGTAGNSLVKSLIMSMPCCCILIISNSTVIVVSNRHRAPSCEYPGFLFPACFQQFSESFPSWCPRCSDASATQALQQPTCSGVCGRFHHRWVEGASWLWFQMSNNEVEVPEVIVVHKWHILYEIMLTAQQSAVIDIVEDQFLLRACRAPLAEWVCKLELFPFDC